MSSYFELLHCYSKGAILSRPHLVDKGRRMMKSVCKLKKAAILREATIFVKYCGKSGIVLLYKELDLYSKY
jgi:hypothetical protein